jgi:hypothetical protein
MEDPMLKRKKKPAAHAGYDINKELPIQQIRVTNGCRYYQVDLGSIFAGKGGHKNFASAKKARAFAAKSKTRPADGGIKATPLRDSKSPDKSADKEIKSVEVPDPHREALELLNPFEVSLYEAACFYAKYHESVEYINHTKAMIEQFIADYQDDLQCFSDSLYREPSPIEKETSSLTGESTDQVADGEAETLQFPDIKHGGLELLNPSNEMPDEVADSAEEPIAPVVEEEQVQAADREEVQPEPPAETQDTVSPIWKPLYIPKNVKAQKTYTPSDVRRIMKTAKPELAPYLALGLFGGLRSAEILKLRWRDVDFELAEIQVNAGQSKVKGKRIVHMQANLGQFLAPFSGKPREFVVPYKQETLQRWTRNLFRELEIKTINQGARHSFAMYHLASHSLDETMEELGYTESAPLHRYYRGLTNRRREQAAKYFAIAPLDHQVEIIPLKKKKDKKAA